jgi:hypothetical protein
MNCIKMVVLSALLMFGITAANAQFGVVVGGPEFASVPPDCQWGYYDYSPYSCADYGYYDSNYFYNGIFIGVGPWYGWGYGHGWGGHRFYGGNRGNGYGNRSGYGNRGGNRGAVRGGTVRGGGAVRGGTVRGGGGARGGFGGGAIRGCGGSRGGGHR